MKLGPVQGLRKLSYDLAAAAWLAYLALGEGALWDETEHCHVAWEMAVLHKRPLSDFFQHHQPLLWDVLRAFYALGGQGLGVVYFGRACLVACGAGSLALLAHLARGARVPLALPCLVLVLGAYLTLPTGFTLRPETLGLPLYLAAVALWCAPAAGHRSPVPRAALAGAAFGLALVSSPRFALLAGGFALLVPDGEARRLQLDWRRWLGLGAGAAAAGTLYYALFGYSLGYLLLTLRFSSLLQLAGQSPFRDSLVRWTWALQTSLPLAALALWLDRGRPRSRWWILAAYFAAVTAASMRAAGGFPYPHAFVVPMAWLAVSAARGLEGVGELDRRWLRFALPAIAVACAAWIGGDLLRRRGNGPAAQNARRERILARLKPGDEVLLTPWSHPITALDAGYYPFPLAEFPDRLCQAVRAYDPDGALPPCDFAAALEQRRPAVVDWAFPRYVSPDQRARVQDVLRSDYLYDPRLPAYVRKDRLEITAR